jgi:hypothetical protein
VRLALVAFAVILATVACGVPPVDELRVERISELHSIPPLAASVTDHATIDALLTKIRSLPTAQLRYCPVDWGVRYDLDFRHQGGQVLHAVAEAGGCKNISLGPGDTRSSDDTFWEMLERALGYPAGDPGFFPTPLN